MAQPHGRAPLPLLLAFGAFLLVLGYLVTASFVKPRVAEFAPAMGTPRVGPGGVVTNTITVDADDEERWQYVSLADAALVPAGASWDLAVRRYHLITAGPVMDAGAVAFDSLTIAPTSGYVATTLARDTVNPVLSHWYRYSFLTHLLRPNGHVYVLRTPEGRFAKLEILSYYCPGVRAGCLTLHYAYQASGAPAF